jgi:hypothetical protein
MEAPHDSGDTAPWACGRGAELERTPVIPFWYCTPCLSGAEPPMLSGVEAAKLPGVLLKGWAVRKFEIELVSKDGLTVIGEANDAESALNLFDKAIRRYAKGAHYRSFGTLANSKGTTRSLRNDPRLRPQGPMSTPIKAFPRRTKSTPAR